MASDRVNTAKWDEKKKMWHIKVQKDGVRKSFYSGKPGRVGQREANAKADAWLSGAAADTSRVRMKDAWARFLTYRKPLIGTSAFEKEEYYGRMYLLPELGGRWMDKLTEMQLQALIDGAFLSGNLSSRKALEGLRSEITMFITFCRKSGWTALHIEGLTIPKNATVGEKRVLQPEDIRKLFACNNTFLRGREQYDDYVNAYRFAVLTGVPPVAMRGESPLPLSPTAEPSIVWRHTTFYALTKLRKAGFYAQNDYFHSSEQQRYHIAGQ